MQVVCMWILCLLVIFKAFIFWDQLAADILADGCSDSVVVGAICTDSGFECCMDSLLVECKESSGGKTFSESTYACTESSG